MICFNLIHSSKFNCPHFANEKLKLRDEQRTHDGDSRAEYSWKAFF